MRRFLAACRDAGCDLSASQVFASQASASQASASQISDISRNVARTDLGPLRRTLLDGSPEEAVAGVLGVLRAGTPVPTIIDVIAAVAAARLGRFDIDLDTDDASDAGWLDVTHTLTYTNALRWAWTADPSPEVLRGVLHAAWFVQWTGKFDAKGDDPKP